MKPDELNEGWTEYRRLVLGQFDDINKAIAGINLKLDRLREEDLTQIKIDVAMLRVKASMLGALAGSAGGALIGLLVARMTGK